MPSNTSLAPSPQPLRVSRPTALPRDTPDPRTTAPLPRTAPGRVPVTRSAVPRSRVRRRPPGNRSSVCTEGENARLAGVIPGSDDVELAEAGAGQRFHERFTRGLLVVELQHDLAHQVRVRRVETLVAA